MAGFRFSVHTGSDMTKRGALVAAAAALYLVSTTALASADPVKNIVLVHGAGVDGIRRGMIRNVAANSTRRSFQQRRMS
jgi:hypothetical protein